ncbi:response regulator [bacterium]|nr:response regulator [bacterium]
MRRRILIIDDEPDVRAMAAAIISTKGHETLEAGDGVEGMEVMERERPDLVICDLMMPRMSGLEVIKRKKRNDALASIPIIILSAMATDTHPPEFWIRSLGVDDYIVKPFDPLDLLGRVEYVFRRSGYVSTRGPVTPTSRSVSTEQTVCPVDLADANPAEVVRAFIESWNLQDFATEFSALAEEMAGGLTRHDYVLRRRRCYIDERGQDRTQYLDRLIEEKISINVAKVVVERRDRVLGADERNRETYTLKKTGYGWKIIAVRPG